MKPQDGTRLPCTIVTMGQPRLPSTTIGARYNTFSSTMRSFYAEPDRPRLTPPHSFIGELDASSFADGQRWLRAATTRPLCLPRRNIDRRTNCGAGASGNCFQRGRPRWPRVSRRYESIRSHNGAHRSGNSGDVRRGDAPLADGGALPSAL